MTTCTETEKDTDRELPGGGLLCDRRTTEEKAATVGYVVATDRFMSGWGKAPGSSYFAVPFAADVVPYIILRNMEDRSEMKRPRIVAANWRPKLRQGDHLSISGLVTLDGERERHWITPGWFSAQNKARRTGTA